MCHIVFVNYYVSVCLTNGPFISTPHKYRICFYVFFCFFFSSSSTSSSHRTMHTCSCMVFMTCFNPICWSRFHTQLLLILRWRYAIRMDFQLDIPCECLIYALEYCQIDDQISYPPSSWNVTKWSGIGQFYAVESFLNILFFRDL